MTTFTVWKFDDPYGADHAATVIRRAASEGLIKIYNHAVVRWPEGASGPSSDKAHEDTWRGTGWGALWGMLIGALFFVPVVGGIAGAAIGAISRAMHGTGITKEQLEKIRTNITEGTSALFLVTDEGNLDRVGERFHGVHMKLVDTNLTEEERQVLMETFAGAR
jgi:uncharacterized membrane protein